MSLRNRELALLLPAVVLVTLGFTIVYLRESGDARLGPRSRTV